MSDRHFYILSQLASHHRPPSTFTIGALTHARQSLTSPLTLLPPARNPPPLPPHSQVCCHQCHSQLPLFSMSMYTQNTAASTVNYVCSSRVDTQDDSKMSRHAARMQFLGPEHKTGHYSIILCGLKVWRLQLLAPYQRKDVKKYPLMVWVFYTVAVIWTIVTHRAVMWLGGVECYLFIV